jgi:hypothetical protein
MYAIHAQADLTADVISDDLAGGEARGLRREWATQGEPAMKILTFKRLVGLAAIGGVAYVHQQRGGEWTLDSLGDTLKYLWKMAMTKLEPVQREVRDTLDRAAHYESAPRGTRRSADEPTVRTFRDYKRKDDVGPH